MALKAKYAKKEEIPAGLESHYKEVSGEWQLDAEGVEDVTGLKSALEKVRTDLRLAKDEQAKWTKLGDYGKAEEALKRVQEIETQQAEAKGQWETLKVQLVEKHDQELKVLRSTIDTERAAINRLVVDNAVITEITTQKGKVKVLLPHIKQRVKAVLEDGEYRAVVVDAKGNPAIQDGKGTPMSIAALVEEFKADPEFMPNFEATGNGGGGADATRRSAGGGASTTALKGSDRAAVGKAALADIASGKVAIDIEA